MKAKKTKQADLRNKQGLFFQVGMLVALALVFASFQYSTNEIRPIDEIGVAIESYEFDMIPITRPEKPKEQIKPKVQPEKFIIVEDPTIDIDENTYFDTEVTADTYVEVIDMGDEPEVEEKKIFYIAEEMPVFPGGDRALLKFIAKNITYPEDAKETGTTGRVFLSFVINKKGFVEDVKIARGVDPTLDNEALRVIKLLPRWKPGKQGGKNVKVGFNVPINFQLN